MTRKEVDLCSLPSDCLRLILSKVDYGRNRQALWALSGSCKTVREALRECPAVVELFGKWNRKSLLKLFSALPEMASLSLHGPPYLGFDTPSRGRAQRDVKSICTWLGQSNLKALDLRDLEAAVSSAADRIVSDEWDELKGITLLPEGLQRLTVLCLDPPPTLEDEINNLADLTCLVSEQLGIWPSLDLTGLKHLSVLTRNSRGYESQHDVSSKRTEFFQHTLVRLSKLTKLEFDLEGLDEELEHRNLFDEACPSSIPGSEYKLPSSIRELTLELSSLKQYKHLVPLLTSLPCLESLKLTGIVYELDEDEDEEEEDNEKVDIGLKTIDLLGAPLGFLRDLTMAGLNIDLPIIRAPNLTSLRFLAPRAHYECQNLKSASIMRIAATTSIRQLELSHWRRWDNLQPLAALPLKHLSIDQGVHVLEAMLKPGCLTSLEMLTLRGVRKGTQLKNKKRLAPIKKGLLALPKFRLLACPGDSLEWDDDQRGADAVDAIVNLHKEKWRCLYSKGSERLYEKV